MIIESAVLLLCCCCFGGKVIQTKECTTIEEQYDREMPLHSKQKDFQIYSGISVDFSGCGFVATVWRETDDKKLKFEKREYSI